LIHLLVGEFSGIKILQALIVCDRLILDLQFPLRVLQLETIDSLLESDRIDIVLGETDR